MQTQYISLEALRFAITRPLIVVISQGKPQPGSLHIIHRLGAEEIMQQNFRRKRTEQEEKEKRIVNGILAGAFILVFLFILLISLKFWR